MTELYAFQKNVGCIVGFTNLNSKKNDRQKSNFCNNFAYKLHFVWEMGVILSKKKKNRMIGLTGMKNT